METDAASIEFFQRLFRGRRDAWGAVKGGCNKEPVTDNHFRLHLEGKQSLGIYMLQDNGTCYFVAIDLDEKNFNKAKSIRQELINAGIYTYIAESKSKGYHIFVFFDNPVKASDIRRALDYVLTKTSVRAEIFPKQSQLDEAVPYGNYINLPCFGAGRPFLTTDLKEVSVQTLPSKIRYNTGEPLARLLKVIPEERPIVPRVLTSTTGPRSKKRPPPCIGRISQGVSVGARDEAAFAYARHLLDQQFIPEEVMGVLLTWDERNKPPLNDERLLETKVKSAEKGYAFGCNSITGKPMLADFCVGEARCEWQRTTYKERLKKGLIQESSFIQTQTCLYEQIIQNGKSLFVSYNKESGQIGFQPSIDLEGYSVSPVSDKTLQAVWLPTGVEEYGDTLQLVASIDQFIHDYVDLPVESAEFATWYILLSWVYDRMTTIAYLRFRGDTGVGKSRCLDVIGNLCYKPMNLSGATTPAPIYRLINKYRGTLIIEEADFRNTDEKSEVITILNCGFEVNRPIIRCRKDDPDTLDVLPCFGPKVMASRRQFGDVALEARCLTFVLEETDRDDIPPILGETFRRRAESLRNKLLLYRLKSYTKIDPNCIEELDVGPVEPRLKQLGLPFALPFKDFPEVMGKFRKFLLNYNKELKRLRSESTDGRVIHAMFKMFMEHGVNNVYPQQIVECLIADFKVDYVKSNALGKRLTTLNITRTSKRGYGGTRAHFIDWKAPLMKKLLRRYIMEPEDYADLFVVDDVEI